MEDRGVQRGSVSERSRMVKGRILWKLISVVVLKGFTIVKGREGGQMGGVHNDQQGAEGVLL